MALNNVNQALRPTATLSMRESGCLNKSETALKIAQIGVGALAAGIVGYALGANQTVPVTTVETTPVNITLENAPEFASANKLLTLGVLSAAACIFIRSCRTGGAVNAAVTAIRHPKDTWSEMDLRPDSYRPTHLLKTGTSAVVNFFTGPTSSIDTD